MSTPKTLAKTIETRKNDKFLNEIFLNLKSIYQWEWLAYACKHTTNESLNYIRILESR